MKKLMKNEQGTVVVIVALAFAVIMVIVALVVDIGRLYLEYTKLSRGTDAAALAAAQELARNPSGVVEVARDYAQRNGVDPDNIVVSVSASDKTVSVQGTENVTLTFAPIIGIRNSDVKARAKAKLGSISAVGGAVPFAVEKQNFKYGQLYVLKYGASAYFDQDGDGIPDSADPDDDNDGIPDDEDIDLFTGARTGWFGALSLGGTGASIYEQNVKYGYKPVLKVGQILYTETGNISGPTSDGVLFRISECHHTPKCSISGYSPDCPSLVWIPVIEPVTSGNQVKQVRIAGFAAFLLQGVGGNGVNNYVKGYFVQEATSGEFGNSSAGYGLMTAKLVE